MEKDKFGADELLEIAQHVSEGQWIQGALTQKLDNRDNAGCLYGWFAHMMGQSWIDIYRETEDYSTFCPLEPQRVVLQVIDELFPYRTSRYADDLSPSEIATRIVSFNDFNEVNCDCYDDICNCPNIVTTAEDVQKVLEIAAKRLQEQEPPDVMGDEELDQLIAELRSR